MAITPQGTILVPFDDKARRRLEKASALMHQSSDAFLGRVGDEIARRILLDWAVEEYCRGERTFGELAEDTGLWTEGIMMAVAPGGYEQALTAGHPTGAGEQTDPALYQVVERIMDELRRHH